MAPVRRHAMLGRDGCRVPLPWSGDRPPVRVQPRTAPAPWLPQPAGWAALTVQRQAADPGSMLSLYRAALRLRREEPGFHETAFAWNDGPAEVLDFDRGAGLRCVVNLGAAAVPVPADSRVLLASAPLDGRDLPPDAAVWLRRG